MSWLSCAVFFNQVALSGYISLLMKICYGGSREPHTKFDYDGTIMSCGVKLKL